MTKSDQIVRFENEGELELLISGRVPHETIKDQLSITDKRLLERLAVKHGVPVDVLLDLTKACLARAFEVPLPRSTVANIENHGLRVPAGVKTERRKLDLS